jgi:hypothetical protein
MAGYPGGREPSSHTGDRKETPLPTEEAPVGSTANERTAVLLEIDVDGRWDALALAEHLVPFHSFLVQQARDQWVVHAQAPGRHGRPLAEALREIAAWRSGRRVEASIRVDGRPRAVTAE